MAFAQKRLQKELLKIQKTGLAAGMELVSFEPLNEWIVDIKVLDENPLYMNQTYRLKMNFSDTYPIEPPEVVFVQLSNRDRKSVV